MKVYSQALAITLITETGPLSRLETLPDHNTVLCTLNFYIQSCDQEEKMFITFYECSIVLGLWSLASTSRRVKLIFGGIEAFHPQFNERPLFEVNR